MVMRMTRRCQLSLRILVELTFVRGVDCAVGLLTVFCGLIWLRSIFRGWESYAVRMGTRIMDYLCGGWLVLWRRWTGVRMISRVVYGLFGCRVRWCIWLLSWPDVLRRCC